MTDAGMAKSRDGDVQDILAKPSTLSRPQRVLLAAMVAGLAAAPWPLRAQQPAVNPSPPPMPSIPPAAQPGAGPGSAAQPPPSWTAGRPEAEEALKLTPVQPPPLATPADKLPVAKLKLPKNFNLEVYAAGLPYARSLRIG